jgi:integrase/recombinase XerD
MTTERFEEFVKGRRWLKNVSKRTEDFYRNVKRSVEVYHTEQEFTKDSLERWVIAMREAGVKPVSVNTYISGLNAYLKWLGTNLHLPRLKVPVGDVPVLNEQQTKVLLAHRPESWTGKRLVALITTMLDTGIRADEAFGLKRKDVDLDNLVLKVHGKGDKYRLVPISVEGRKIVAKWLLGHNYQLAFPNKDGSRLKYRMALRQYTALCKRLGVDGVKTSFHPLRHTFATNYLRRGGDVARLQRILGHTTIAMTMKYVHLAASDLVEGHDRLTVVGTR